MSSPHHLANTTANAYPLRRGIRLGIDVGTVRVGVAQSDPEGILATPVATYPRGEALQRIVTHVCENGVREIIVGLPVSLSGRDSKSTEMAVAFAKDLYRALETNIPVRLVDERLSSMEASRSLHEVGINSRKQKQIIDQQAAVVILEHALDEERRTGKTAGRTLTRRQIRRKKSAKGNTDE